jgi:hypothetical protein
VRRASAARDSSSNLSCANWKPSAATWWGSGAGAGTSWNSVSHFTGPIDPATGEPIFDLAKAAFDRFRCD